MDAYDVVLLPSFSQVEDWRKRRAGERTEGLFMQTVTTFDAWVDDLWELHGDGRTIVDRLQRQVVMHAAFDRLCAGGSSFAPQIADACGQQVGQPEGALTASPGIIALAAECARAAAGIPAFQDVVGQAMKGLVPEGLSLREVALLQVVGCYEALLSSVGLVERGQALACLADEAERVFPRTVSVLCAQAAPATWHEQFFFGSCAHLRVVRDEAAGADGIRPLAHDVELCFGFPSGRYAQLALVADVLRQAFAHESSSHATQEQVAIVACKDPLGMFRSIQPMLANEGIAARVQAQVPFASTDFGRRFLALASVLESDDWAACDLSDSVWPPFAGFNMGQALGVDAALRSNRIAQRDECLERLRVASDVFSQLEELATDPEADILLGVFEQIAFNAPNRDAAWRAQQLSAASALRSCTAAARRVGAGMAACLQVLRAVKIGASFEASLPEGVSARRRGSVLITTQSAAAQMGAGSCAQLVLCDLTSDDYPVSDKDNAAVTLFAKLGLTRVEPALASERRSFARLQALPTVKLFCCRPLNDWDGNPTYPSAALQELIDSYRADATDDGDVDEVFGLPQRFKGSVIQRGEEDLFANARVKEAGCSQRWSSVGEACDMGLVRPDAVESVALPRYLPEGACVGFSPSASQIESYLDCPYKWFVQSRVKVETLDEGFGPLERGTFAHAVLREFYQRFQQSGQRKVNAENLAQARSLMQQVCDELAAEQPQLEPGSGRYVAASQIEQRELQATKAELVSYLDFEQKLLPGFYPRYFEYELQPQDAVRYAGNAFVGIVDRIDVDDKGNAVIVDYKGSAGAQYEIAGKGPQDPGKVQTRIYAQAVRRALGLNVVGALYVSYGKSQGCSGAFDARAIEAQHLPGMRHDKCGCLAADGVRPESVDDYSKLDFADMLDATEELVAGAAEAMAAGRIAPDPAKPESCEYCPVSNCPKRGA